MVRALIGSLGVGFFAAGVLASCSAAGPGGENGGRSGNGNTGGGSQGSGGIIVGAGGGSGGTTVEGCQQTGVTFEPQTPTVVILVDRSTSMWDGNFWDPLKTALLNVVQALQTDVRFGFTAYTGYIGGLCPELNQAAAISLNNYDAVATAYEAASIKPTMKTETPTGRALEAIYPMLAAFPEPGAKYVLLVTDGLPDFCDDNQADCAKDHVVKTVQNALAATGIRTLVLGLGTAADVQQLQDVANAGAGQPVVLPSDCQLGPTGLAMHCKAHCAAVGGPAATYAAAGGTARYYSPVNPTDAVALETELRAAIAGLKSCTFDLQGQIKVDLTQLALASITIDGQPVPLDDVNGWHMISETTVQLEGAACQAWLLPTAIAVDFDFPCEIIVPK